MAEKREERGAEGDSNAQSPPWSSTASPAAEYG
ncbi:hypothetical protein TIFTF001_020900 [Ficus carica]|uniref:Uncharacterized protein n=1 Tax=Ficus carica TaxID=3494 RepID=A0AA88DA87_FICCA|nr:hypothetical protein TIFTF001_020900 [Ficus carica]